MLRYEEDLSDESGESARVLRMHLAEAQADGCDAHPIIAVPSSRRQPAVSTSTSYYPRKDLLGHLATFDGERFVIEFRRIDAERPTKAQTRSARRHA